MVNPPEVWRLGRPPEREKKGRKGDASVVQDFRTYCRKSSPMKRRTYRAVKVQNISAAELWQKLDDGRCIIGIDVAKEDLYAGVGGPPPGSRGDRNARVAAAVHSLTRVSVGTGRGDRRAVDLHLPTGVSGSTLEHPGLNSAAVPDLEIRVPDSEMGSGFSCATS